MRGRGPTPLGIEVRARGGRQRFAFQVTVADRSYPPRAVVLPEVKKAMLSMPRGVRDGRLVQLYLRTVSTKQEWRGAFRPPVATPPEPSFGCPQTYDAEPPVEGKTDAIWGEYHRGLDYLVPAGTEVSSPAAGTVLFAGPLLLTGETVMVDHGQGVVSVFYHLDSTPRRSGDWVDAGAPLGKVGETGIAAGPSSALGRVRERRGRRSPRDRAVRGLVTGAGRPERRRGAAAPVLAGLARASCDVRAAPLHAAALRSRVRAAV